MNKKLLLLIIFLAITIGFATYRSSTGLVWDDSPHVTINLYEIPQKIPFSLQTTAQAFGKITTQGYRPLLAIGVIWGVDYFSQDDPSVFLWSLGIGALIALLAISFYFVAKRFITDERFAVLAVVLFLCSSPILAGSWVIAAGIGLPSIVPLMICLGLLTHWKLRSCSTRQSGQRITYSILLGLILLCGPWFREFIGILAILIIIDETLYHKRITILTGVSSLALLHAVFPTFLIHWIFLPELPLTSVFNMGSLGSQVDVNIGTIITFQRVLDIFSRINKDAFYSFLVLLPSFFMLCIVLGGGLFCVRKIKSIFSKQPTEKFNWYLFIFLISWLFLSFTPFLWIFAEELHLAYALVPLSILASQATLYLYDALSKYFGSRYVSRAFIVITVLFTSDQALNIVHSYRVVNGMNEGIEKVAKWFQNNVKKDSLVICNALQLEDIRYFSKGHFISYWTVAAGIPSASSRSIIGIDSLQRFLIEHKNQDIYFLDIDYNFMPHKVSYHSHRFVRSRAVPMEALGKIHTTQIRYLYLDPVKNFIPRRYTNVLFSPDLENDVYRGLAQNGTPFVREVYAEYYVYKVIGDTVSSQGLSGWPKDAQQAFIKWLETQPRPINSESDPNVYYYPQPVLLREGYRKFNFVGYQNRIYAVLQGEYFNISRTNSNSNNRYFSGTSEEEVSQLIDKEYYHSQPTLLRGNYTQPTLLVEGYRGFNLVGYQDRIYAILQGEGAFDIDRINNNGYSRFFTGTSVKEVLQLIDNNAVK